MSNHSDQLVKFHEFAVKNQVAYSLHWGEQGFWEDVEIISAAESERYHEKKVANLLDFIERWSAHVKSV